MFGRLSAIRKSDRTIPTGEQFFKLIEKGKWDKVRKLLRSNLSGYSRLVDRSGLSTLAVSVSSYGPLDIVKAIIEANPESTSHVDQYGASPLHVACLNGTNLDTFHLIMAHDKDRSGANPDKNNYTVLHHAVEHVCMLIENRYFGEDHVMCDSMQSIESEHGDYLEIIRTLCQQYPETVHIATNDNGDTPLDIPQIIMMRRSDNNNSNSQHCKRLMEVYQLLKEASIRFYREKRMIWENEYVKQRPICPESKTASCDNSAVSSLVSSVSSQSQFRDSGNSFLSANVSAL
jgi:hypothetical protein